MQYPAMQIVRHSTRVARFLDGAEQRFRIAGRPLRSWIIRLDLLDEAELTALNEFFTGQQGRFGSFSFIDPGDGKEYADCSLAHDEFVFQLNGEMRATTGLIVRENRD